MFVTILVSETLVLVSVVLLVVFVVNTLEVLVEVVIENYDSLDEDTKRKLEAIDELAIKYDETRDKIVDDKDVKYNGVK